MPWPSSQDYNEAIQSPGTSFADAELRIGEAVCGEMGLPMPRSGNFADVYEFRCPSSNRSCAVKCFTRQIPGLRQRYTEISRFLEKAKLPFMVEFTFLQRGILIRGDWFPVLKMQWVEGFTLNQFVKDHLDRPEVLDSLGRIWLRLARQLQQRNMAHGDLQHGNVLLVPGSKAGALQVKLVDYDGMWVPALAPLKSHEAGHPSFQHPLRIREGTYDQTVDRFSHLVIYTACRGLITGGRSLWERYDTGDNMLFTAKDFEDPGKSPLFRELQQTKDPELQRLTRALMESAKLPLDKVPLLEKVATAEKTVAIEPAEEKPLGPSQFAAMADTPMLSAHLQRRKPGGNKKLLWGLVIAGALAALIVIGAVITTAAMTLYWILSPPSKSGSEAVVQVDQEGPRSEVATGSSSQGDPPASSPSLPPPASSSSSAGEPVKGSGSASAGSGSGSGSGSASKGSGSSSASKNPGSGSASSSSSRGSGSGSGSASAVVVHKDPDIISLRLADGIELKLVLIRAKEQTFWMGSPEGEAKPFKAEQAKKHPGYSEAQHEVKFSHDYRLGVVKVTQAQYHAIIGANPSHFSKNGAGFSKLKGVNPDELPVEDVGWKQANAFCDALTAKFKNRGWKFRLPTEAEWEYACRARDSQKESAPFYLKNGPSQSLSGGQVNFNGLKPFGEGKKGKPSTRPSRCGDLEDFPDSVNTLGLYDMHGNVWEWCEDQYNVKYDKDCLGHVSSDPLAPRDQSRYVAEYAIRGGAWVSPAEQCRAAARAWADEPSLYIGFRVCAVAEPAAK